MYLARVARRETHQYAVKQQARAMAAPTTPHTAPATRPGHYTQYYLTRITPLRTWPIKEKIVNGVTLLKRIVVTRIPEALSYPYCVLYYHPLSSGRTSTVHLPLHVRASAGQHSSLPFFRCSASLPFPSTRLFFVGRGVQRFLSLSTVGHGVR